MRTRFQLTTSSLFGAFGSVAAVIVALLLGAVVISVAGSDPVEAYRALWDGAFVGRRSIGDTLIYTAPLILGGLAFAVAARAGMFNIGIEGQLVVGGFAAALVGAWDFGLPKVIYLPLALVVAAVAGGIWGFIPGFLRAKTGAHEVITTIMLNYLAFRLITYLVLKQDKYLPVSPNNLGTDKVVDAARLPRILDGTRLHAGILIALAAAVLLWFVLYHTTFGYNVRAVGLSRGASAYGGINWGTTIMIAMTLAGAFAGLAGAGESLGLHGRHYTTPPGYGFTSIAVGLVGRNNPLAIILSGLLFGALSAGAPSMQSADVSKEIVLVIQGLIILAVAALEVVRRLPTIRARMAKRTAARGAARSGA
ncbi:MAG TPA: ABC transporter permease [Thermomicrobiales bacterium]|nr:ABC transporter permease [Thermomicrobiales bacterium]